MPGKGFIAMPPKQGPPVIHMGYPSDRDADGVWTMLLQNDNVSVLLTTKESRYSADGLFLSLPAGPLDETAFIQPVQSKPMDAQQAAWVMEPAPRKRHRLRHVASDRYLMVIENKIQGVNKKHAVSQKLPEPVVSTCAAKACLPGAADFDIWPKSEFNEVPQKFTLVRAPWEKSEVLETFRKEETEVKGPQKPPWKAPKAGASSVSLVLPVLAFLSFTM